MTMTPAWLASTTTSNPPRRKSQPSTSRQRSLVSRENDSLPFLEPLQRRPPRPSPEHPRPPDPSPVSVPTRYSAGRQRLSQRKGESMRTGEFQKRFGRGHNLLFGTAFAALAASRACSRLPVFRTQMDCLEPYVLRKPWTRVSSGVRAFERAVFRRQCRHAD